MSIPAITHVCVIISESKRIIKSPSVSIRGLPFIFLSPLSLCLIILNTSFHSTVFITTQNLLLYSFFVFFLFICAVATISNSTYHGIHGRHLKLSSAIKSLLKSLVPLVSTALASLALVFFISLVFFLIVILVTKVVDFKIDYQSTAFSGLCVVVLVLVLELFWQVNMGLAWVIVVVESKWGFEPLWRSVYLVRGMRKVSFSIMILFGAPIGFFVSGYLTWGWGQTADGLSTWRDWSFILQTLTGLTVSSVYMLHYVVANTALFVCCKALHGELAFQIEGQFDDEKHMPSHVFSLVQP